MMPVRPREDGGKRVTWGATQPDVESLPSTVSADHKSIVTTEWEMTAEEMQLLMEGGRVRLMVWTFGHPLQPVNLMVIPKPPVEVPA